MLHVRIRLSVRTCEYVDGRKARERRRRRREKAKEEARRKKKERRRSKEKRKVHQRPLSSSPGSLIPRKRMNPQPPQMSLPLCSLSLLFSPVRQLVPPRRVSPRHRSTFFFLLPPLVSSLRRNARETTIAALISSS